MNKKYMIRIVSMLGAATLGWNSSLTAFATSVDDYTPSEKAIALIDSICDDLGFDATMKEQISRASIPAELYYYFDASGLHVPNNTIDEFFFTINYVNNYYDYVTHSDQPIVSTYSVSDSNIGSGMNEFDGKFYLAASPGLVYNGNITAIRFKAHTVGTDLHTLFAALPPTVSIDRLRVPPFDWTSTAFNYISIDKRVPGDINCNGYVTNTDAGLIADIVANVPPPTPYSTDALLSADVDRNGLIDVNDVTLVLQVLAGTVNHF